MNCILDSRITFSVLECKQWSIHCCIQQWCNQGFEVHSIYTVHYCLEVFSLFLHSPSVDIVWGISQHIYHLRTPTIAAWYTIQGLTNCWGFLQKTNTTQVRVLTCSDCISRWQSWVCKRRHSPELTVCKLIHMPAWRWSSSKFEVFEVAYKRRWLPIRYIDHRLHHSLESAQFKTYTVSPVTSNWANILVT